MQLVCLFIFAFNASANRELPPCEYLNWDDERGHIFYCFITETSLSSIFKVGKNIFTGDSDHEKNRLIANAVKFDNVVNFEYIPREIFVTFPNISGLMIEYSDIPKIKDNLFGEKFKVLKFVEFQHNDKLENIDEDAFKFLLNLEWIRLASNRIKLLCKNIFKTNKKLTYVDLRNNRITAITPILFDRNSNLQQVLLKVKNQCVRKDFLKSDGSLSILTQNLEECFANCESNLGRDTCGEQNIGGSLVVHGAEFQRGWSKTLVKNSNGWRNFIFSKN